MIMDILSKYNNFYLLGIGGVSMSSLAKLLISFKKSVTGYDRQQSQFTENLEKMGVNVEYDYEKIVFTGVDLVVYSDAFKIDERIINDTKNLKLISRGQFLAYLCKRFRSTIAVAGCHGKTTCSCMLTHVFNNALMNFSSHIGGNDILFGNCYVSGEDFFITEACEYKRNLDELDVDLAVILNNDLDHMECYSSPDELCESYIKFANRAKEAVYIYGLKNINKGISFGFNKKANYYAKNIKVKCQSTSFEVIENKRYLGEIKLNVFGKHNVLNALAAIAVARYYGIAFEYIKCGLDKFLGVERRFERMGYYNGAICIADYAHHPTEINALLQTTKKITNGKIFVIFQPHTYSRTKYLFKEFIKVLSTIPRLLIYKTFPAREVYDEAGDAIMLHKNIRGSEYAIHREDIITFLAKVGSKDVVLFIGAGDIYAIAKSIIKIK